MKDSKPYERYFRYDPIGDVQTAWTPFVGEVEVGRIYAINDEQRAAILQGHPEWTAVTKKDYNAQCKADGKEQTDDDEE